MGLAVACAMGGILFNLILGLPAAMAAARHGRRVKSAWAAGDQEGAAKASRRALRWVIASAVFDLAGLGLAALLVLHGHTTTG
jgi:hypothetical protein